MGFGVQPASHAKIFISKDYPAPGTGGSACCRQAGWSGTYDKKVAMQEPVIIYIRIGESGQAAKAGS
jgi:hypothetical protein